MKKHWVNQFNRLRCDNRGSSVVVVMVLMSLLVILGTLLMDLTYFNVKMKQQDKAEKANFYSAENVMDEVRLGLQANVSNAIKAAYQNVLENYSTTADNAVRAQNFKNEFYQVLYQEKIGSEQLFTPSGSGYVYNTAALQNLVTVPGSVTLESSAAYKVEPDGDLGITLRGLTVKYVANRTYTSVTTDVRIHTPMFNSVSGGASSTILDFAVVAKGALQQANSSGPITINGNIYAGGALVPDNGNIPTVQNANKFILNGPLTLTGGAISFDAASNLWTTDITVGSGAQLTTRGTVQVANDLNLQGDGARVTLAGAYYGYGNKTVDNTTTPTPSGSSAILINGKKTYLDMNNLVTLMLAGHSYVDYATTSNSPADYVMMGESISVKSNQLAYLVPDECMSGVSNPYYYTTDPGNTQLLAYVDLTKTFPGGKALRDYGIKNTDNIQLIREPAGGEYIVYFCLKFPTAQDANNYFKDYYTANAAKLQKYLDMYTDGILLSGAETKTIAGDLVTYNGDNFGTFSEGVGTVPDTTPAKLAEVYKNLCVTLDKTVSEPLLVDSAYEYYVNTAELSALSGEKTYYLDEATRTDPRVIVKNGDLVIDDATDRNIRLVIASGDVTVRWAFKGLIIAGGKVTLYNNVTEDDSGVTEALKTLLTLDKTHYYYLNEDHVKANEKDSGNTWDVNALVSFENWVKNEA